MREKMEKFAILPFSIGCVSHSSVAVSENQGRSRKARAETSEESPSSTAKMMMIKKPNISGGFQKIIKSLSNLFMVYDDDEEEEEEETEMEIGSPTDVRHIGHIGWDGLNNTSTSNLKRLDKGPDIFSIHSLSLKQFELAMDDAHGDGPRDLLNSSLRHF